MPRSPHKLSMKTHTIISVLRQWNQVDLKFKVIFNYIGSSKLAYVRDFVSKKKTWRMQMAPPNPTLVGGCGGRSPINQEPIIPSTA